MSSNSNVTAVVREYAPFVRRVLRHQGVPDNQLDDLSQEVFVVVMRRLSEFEERSALTTWMFSICRNIARTARRSQGRKPELVTAEPPDVAHAETQTSATERAQLRARLNAALQTLAEPTRMVFVLYEIEGLSMEHTAEALNCNVNTAYSRLYSAREQLRAALVEAGVIDAARDLAEVV